MPGRGRATSSPAIRCASRPGTSASATAAAPTPPTKYYLVESTHPKLQGMDGAVISFAEYLYELAG